MALTLNFNFDLKSLKSTSPRRGNEFNNNVRQKSRKCLFGSPNPEETYQMAKENFDQERERFYQRFGIHMEDLDRFTINEDEYKKMKYRPVMPAPSPSSSSNGGGKMVNKKTIRMKRALKPYNANNHLPSTQTQQQQMKITDFCQVKKSPTSSILDNANAKLMPLQNLQPQHNKL